MSLHDTIIVVDATVLKRATGRASEAGCLAQAMRATTVPAECGTR